jgi:hypothetical protein
LAMPVASSMIPGFTSAFFEECDLKLAEASLPAELKLMEGLLKNDPGNSNGSSPRFAWGSRDMPCFLWRMKARKGPANSIFGPKPTG